MKKLTIYRILVAVLLLGWMVLIFTMSSETAETSSDTSGSIIKFFFKIFDPNFDSLAEIEQQALIEPFQFIVRKAAHFTIYAILGVLAFLNAVTLIRFSLIIRSVMSLGFSLLYSITDEIHQLSVSGRSGELRDVLIDFCGALLGITIISLIYNKTKKFPKK